MDENEFWEIIEDSFEDGAVPDDGLKRLEATLESFPRGRVVDFQIALGNVMSRAYRWDLFGAACFVGCGEFDAGFEDFRAWLITQGRDVFEDVLHDVSELVNLPYDESPAEEWYLEELHQLPGEVAGEDEDPGWPYHTDPDTPEGEAFELTKDELRRRFPTLWEEFEDRFMAELA